MELLIADVRYAARSLWKSPGFTAVAVLTLGLGIGGNSAIFTLIDAVLLRPPSGVVEPDRLVTIYTSDFSSGDFGTSSYPDFQAIRAEREVFAGVAAYSFRPVSLSLGEQAEMLNATLVSPEYFSVLGLAPSAGRLMGGDDVTAPGASPVAVVSHAMWWESASVSTDGRTARGPSLASWVTSKPMPWMSPPCRASTTRTCRAPPSA